MSGTHELIEYTRHAVEACNLHTASVFVCDRSRLRPALKYLVHVNVPDQAQYSYMHEGVFSLDPFSGSERTAPRPDSELILGPELTAARRGKCGDYWSFIDHYGIETVAASTRALAPGMYSTIGFHHSRDRKRRGDVPLGQLATMARQIQAMVAADMLQMLLQRPEGQIAWRQSIHDVAARAAPRTKPLSPREAEIAALICQGRLNKEIAYLTGLSEYTIENHLRRIYRKFGVRNRTALAAAMAQETSH
jgi:DNA-binding CsgD family transcriptional regulator